MGNQVEVRSDITGSVWKIEVSEKDHVSEGDVLMILESMKMEIPILAPVDGVITTINVQESHTVQGDDVVIIMEEK